jgi:type I restriction enzyme S subunit
MKAGWQSKKLGEIISLEYGKALPDGKRVQDGLYPAYGANGIKDRTNEYLVDCPTIVVGRKGSAGEIKLTEGKIWALDVTYYTVFDEKKLNIMFLYYLLSTLELTKLAKGVKPGINRNDVYAIDVAFPPLPEQQRIVSILDEAFEGISTAVENAEQNLINAREFFEAFRESAFQSDSRDWSHCQLGEMASFRNGINFSKSSKGVSIKIIGVSDFQNSFWAPFDTLDSVIIDGKLPVSDLVKEGDIFFVRSNGNPELIGRCLLAGEVLEDTTHSGFTIRARLHTSTLTPQYLCNFLKSKRTRKKMVDGGNGVNIKSLNQTTLSTLVIPVPSLNEQQTIVSKLDALSEETQRLESIYQQKIADLDELKKSILHQAFSGQLK